MKIVIFHYHVQPGGVTSVIRLSVESIAAQVPEVEEIVLVSGSEENGQAILEGIKRDLPPRITCSVSIMVLPEIGYISESEISGIGLEELKEKLLTLFSGSFWWVHNYQIGKNPVFTRAIVEIAGDCPDQRIVLQLHDFRECARYSNLVFLDSYYNGSLYPRGENIDYGVINSRDRELLIEAGLDPGKVHLLPNPARIDEAGENGDPSRDLSLDRLFSDREGFLSGRPVLLYPVRSIRRKNVLEAGLVAKLFPEPVNLLTTLPGTSANEQAYSRLVEEAYNKKLIPGLFGDDVQEVLSRENIDFQHFIEASDSIISSSIQEGFGYLFLQAIHAAKPLFARDIETSRDFTRFFSPSLHRLYSSLPVPLGGMEKQELYDRYDAYLKTLRVFLGHRIVDELHYRIEMILSEPAVDFSYLSPEMQYRILSRCADRHFLKMIAELNGPVVSHLSGMLEDRDDSYSPDLEAEYGMEIFARRWARIAGIAEGERGADAGRPGGPVQPAAETDPSSPDFFIRKYFARPEYIRLLYAPYPS